MIWNRTESSPAAPTRPLKLSGGFCCQVPPDPASRCYPRGLTRPLGVASDAHAGELTGGEMSGDTAHLASIAILDICSVFEAAF